MHPQQKYGQNYGSLHPFDKWKRGLILCLNIRGSIIIEITNLKKYQR